MLVWLIDTFEEGDPSAAGGRPLPGWLSPEEAAACERLHTVKRRWDWLHGRYTAKRLAQAVLLEETGRLVPLDRLFVGNHPSGEPFIVCREPAAAGLPLTLSISHSGGRAACALAPAARLPLGVDLEEVAPRSAGFVADYFTAEEREQVDQGGEDERPLLATAIWSAKEAVLKALHKGLSVDTRSVTVRLDAAGGRAAGWRRFEVELDPGRLPPEALIPLNGWWRIEWGFVLTIAAGTKTIPTSLRKPAQLHLSSQAKRGISTAHLRDSSLRSERHGEMFLELAKR